MAVRVEDERRVVVGKAYLLDDSPFLALQLAHGVRMVAFMGDGTVIATLVSKRAVEIREEEPSVRELCIRWGISVAFFDAWVEKHCYSLDPDWQAGRARPPRRGWTGFALEPGEGRGRVFGLSGEGD